MTVSLKNETGLLAKHSLIYGLGNLMNRIIALLLLPIYTRFLTPTDYGVKELVGLTTDVIGILLATAISSAIHRFYFEYESQKDRHEVISSAIITIGCFGLVAVLLLSMTTKTLAFYILDSANLYHYFLISFASLWFSSLNEVGNNYFRATQQSLKYILLSFSKLILALSLNIYFICYLKYGVLGILYSTLLSSMVMSCVILFPIVKTTGLKFSKEKIKQMLKFGLPMIPSQLGAFVVHLSDRFFIKAYCSIADAGLYSLGYRFGTLPSTFISGPFNQTWLPRRFQLYKEEGAEKVFGKIFTYFLALMAFASLAVAALTKEVLMVMAAESFWGAYTIVPIIVLASTVFSFHYHLNMGILITKKTKYLAYINFSNGLFVLVLNFLLIPKYGVYGAAYATLIAFVYKIGLTYYFSRKYYKIYFEAYRIFKIILSACLIYLATYYIYFDHIIVSFAVKMVLICIYPALLFILGFFTEEEKLAILRVLLKMNAKIFKSKLPFLK